MLVLAQIAVRLGAPLGPLDDIPERVAAVLALPGPLVAVPNRLVELIGAGPNGWTAQEGALKIREASYVAAEGLSAEQFFHGPSVALDEQDTLVVLDGGGPMADRTHAIADAVEVTGAKVAASPSASLGEALSVFPLTVSRPTDRARARRGPRRRVRTSSATRRTRAAKPAFEGVGF